MITFVELNTGVNTREQLISLFSFTPVLEIFIESEFSGEEIYVDWHDYNLCDEVREPVPLESYVKKAEEIFNCEIERSHKTYDKYDCLRSVALFHMLLEDNTEMTGYVTYSGLVCVCYDGLWCGETLTKELLDSFKNRGNQNAN